MIFWPKCTRLQDSAYTISKFPGGDTRGPLQKRSRCLDPDTKFPRGSPAFPLFLFCETTTQLYGVAVPVDPVRYCYIRSGTDGTAAIPASRRNWPPLPTRSGVFVIKNATTSDN